MLRLLFPLLPGQELRSILFYIELCIFHDMTERIRGPPKKGRTPASESDSETVLREWEETYRKLTTEGEMTKWGAMKVMAETYSVARSTIDYHLHETVRVRELERQKKTRSTEVGKKQRREYRQTVEVRSTQASRVHLRRHLPNYLLGIFEDREGTLSLDELTVRLGEALEAEGRPRAAVMRRSTLIRLAHEKYGPPLLQEVEGSGQPTLYKLRRHDIR